MYTKRTCTGAEYSTFDFMGHYYIYLCANLEDMSGPINGIGMTDRMDEGKRRLDCSPDWPIPEFAW